MTISSSTRKAGPFIGTGLTTVFPFGYKVFATTDVLVVKTDALLVERTLELGPDYTVTLSTDQENDPGGSVILAAPLASGHKLTLGSKVPETQLVELTNAGGFYPRVINQAFDRLTILVQQLTEQLGRTLKLPFSSNIDTTFPLPVPNGLIGFNSDASGLTMVDPTDLITVAGYADARVELFTGDGVETNFVIAFNPGVLPNLDVSISGVVQVAGVDFTWSGVTVIFAVAPFAGAAIQIRYARPIAPVPNFDSILTSVGDAAASAAAAEAAAAEAQAAVANVPGLAHWQRFVAKIENANEDASLVLIGDSTGDATNEWYYLLAVSVAALYPTHTVRHRLWNAGGSVYDAATTIQTGTGARTITFWNGSVAGSVASYFSGGSFTGAVQTPAPDLVIASYGHNGGTDARRQLSFFDSTASALKTRLPDVPVIQIGQNPTLSDETMAAKVNVFRDFAARNGWGFISVHDAFKQAGVALAALLADEVHPNAAGSILWRDTVLASLRASRAGAGSGTITPSALIRSWSSFADFNQWQKSNATLSSDNTAGFYETAGASAKLTTTSTAAAGYLLITAVSSSDAPAYAGKYVTFAVWQRVPTGNVSGSGRVEIEDDAGATVSTGAVQGSDFIVFTVTRKITASPTFIKLYYYSADQAGSPANVVYADRASLSLGLTPVDPLSAIETSTRFLRVYGSGAAGVGAIYNAASTGTGLQAMSSATANPETGYAASVSADGFKVKAEADAFDRASLGVGGVRFGSGAAITDMGIDRQLGGVMRVSGADLYPDGDGTRYFGAGNTQWRSIYSKEGLMVANLQVVGPRKTGWAVDTGTAKRTANDTYVAGATLTYSATYVQAEHTAMATRVAAIEAALQNATQTIKAIKDDMHATAGHGLIGS